MKRYIGQARLISIRNRDFSVEADLFWDVDIKCCYFALDRTLARKFSFLETGWLVHVKKDDTYVLYKKPVMKTIRASLLHIGKERFIDGIYLKEASLVDAYANGLWGHRKAS